MHIYVFIMFKFLVHIVAGLYKLTVNTQPVLKLSVTDKVNSIFQYLIKKGLFPLTHAMTCIIQNDFTGKCTTTQYHVI